MRPYLILLFISLAFLQSNFVRAQLTLEFAKSGRVSSTTLSAFHTPGDVTIIVNDPDKQQPESKYQKLINTHTPGFAAALNSDASLNGAVFPYKANGNNLNYLPATSGKPARHEIIIPAAPSGEFTLKITRTIIDNYILKKHFENISIRKLYVDFVPYLTMYDSLKVIYDQYAEQIEKLALQDTLSPSPSNKIELGLSLNLIKNVQSQLVSLVEKVKTANKPWIDNWKWLSEGKEMLNPFFPNVSFLKSRVDQRIASQEALLNFLQNGSSLVDIPSSEEYLQLDKIVSGLTTVISLLKKEKLQLEALESKNKTWLTTSSNPEALLNEFKFYLSKPDKKEPIVWMQHKDAAQSYVAMNNDGPNTVFEEDQMLAYVHNLKPDQKVKASETVEPTPLTTTTEEALEDPFDALKTAKEKSTDILSLLTGLKGLGLSLIGNSSSSFRNKSSAGLWVSSINIQQKDYEEVFLTISTVGSTTALTIDSYNPSLHKNLFGDEVVFLLNQQAVLLNLKKQVLDQFKNNTSYTSPILITLNSPNKNDLIGTIDAFLANVEGKLLSLLDWKKKLVQYRTDKVIIHWFAIQTPPPFQELENALANPGNKPNFKSENVLTGESRSAKGSNRISYTLTEEGKSTAVAKDEYTIYKTVRFWPTLGINYVFGSRNSMVFSNTANIFETQPDIDNFEAVAGVKIYLAKGGKNITTSAATRNKIKEIGKDNKRLGNHFGSGTFLHVGLGISHKFLKNYFVGLGHDLFPGVSVQAGGHLFFRKAYDLQNGQIKSSVDIPSVRPYVGLYLDPTLVTRLIQLF
ncbi:MAG: hypothetical protein U0X91_12860 [Spirosomataceae bacterium]